MKTEVQKQRKSRAVRPKKFRIDCYPYIFSDEEREVLEQKGHDLKTLTAGKRKAVTREEKLFLKVCKGERPAFSIMETAWVKYQNRRIIEEAFMRQEEEYLEFLKT